MLQNVSCSNCGSANLSNARYCSRCGYELPKSEVPAEATPPSVPARARKIKTGKWIGILTGSVAGLAVLFVLQYYLFHLPSHNKMMEELAGKISESCPRMIDTETRLDNALALPGNTFQYNYTLVNAELASFDTMTVKALAEPGIIEFVKTEPRMEYPREQNTTINYCYHDKNGAYLFTVSVTPDQYD